MFYVRLMNDTYIVKMGQYNINHISDIDDSNTIIGCVL
jgi:hypothetical protein